ncbi:hypothetical protein C0J52_15453 [Blattella germanica]|nr:hypothetical protein C0J52_15453 [Blattella germanica]
MIVVSTSDAEHGNISSHRNPKCVLCPVFIKQMFYFHVQVEHVATNPHHSTRLLQMLQFRTNWGIGHSDFYRTS